jgi:hypothetical protein
MPASEEKVSSFETCAVKKTMYRNIFDHMQGIIHQNHISFLPIWKLVSSTTTVHQIKAAFYFIQYSVIGPGVA